SAKEICEIVAGFVTEIYGYAMDFLMASAWIVSGLIFLSALNVSSAGMQTGTGRTGSRRKTLAVLRSLLGFG
ncbi:MAG: hypothetical protein M1417_01160, partial [Candidatus Thermoplasmatota archaeon]|nr:hypothetical protein [Candidatus Thermoplasmatota archaeon]